MFMSTSFVYRAVVRIRMSVIVTKQSNLRKSHLPNLSLLAAANGFVWSWPHLKRCLLDPRVSSLKTASRSAAYAHIADFLPFAAANRFVWCCPQYNSPLHGSLDLHESVPKRYLDRFSRFCRLTLLPEPAKSYAFQWAGQPPELPLFVGISSLSNTRFLGSTHPNGVSIGSAVSADTQTDRPRYSVCRNSPHLMHWVHAIWPKSIGCENNLSKGFPHPHMTCVKAIRLAISCQSLGWWWSHKILADLAAVGFDI